MEDKIICTESELNLALTQVTYMIMQMEAMRFNKIMTLRRSRITFINISQPTPRKNKDYSSMMVKSIAWYCEYDQSSLKKIREWKNLKEQINAFLISLRMTRNPQCHVEGENGMEIHVMNIESTPHQNPIPHIIGDECKLLLKPKDYRRIWSIFESLPKVI